MDIKEHTFFDANIIRAKVHTSGPRGGDSGSGGGFSLVELSDEGSTDWRVGHEKGGRPVEWTEQPTKIYIRVGGDAESRTLARALRWVAWVLEDRHGPLVSLDTEDRSL